MSNFELKVDSNSDPMTDTVTVTVTTTESAKAMDEIATSLELIQLRKNLSDHINKLLNDHDCNRFLRARKYDIEKAETMIRKWADWYEQPVVEGSLTPKQYSDGTIIDEKEHVFTQLMPHANLGVDKNGHPIYWEKTGQISSAFLEVKKHLSEDEIFLRHVRQQEMMVRRIKKSAEKRGKLIEKQVLVMDLKDLSFRIDFMAMRCFRKLLQYDDSCYPERLHVCFMINAPMSFTATWAIIKPWLDPVTAEKMQIIGSNYQDKLKEYIDVEQIPIEYGGTKENFSWVWDNNYED